MYKKILVTLDGSKTAEQILPHVEALNSQGSEVHLLRVALAHTLPGVDPTEAQVQVVKEAEEYLSRVEEGLRGKGLKVESHVRYGHPAEEILDHTEHWKFDLIAMTTHGRTGVGRWLLGSVAEKVVRNSPVPVLVVRAKKE
ncbi:MAG: universal stress protein [Candidatus Tectomicrobia bacterium]|nr:universal stress protein [Candidatus Tectomicrobia bacterium]